MGNTAFRKNYLGRIIPPNLLIPLAVTGIVIVAVSMFLEYRSRQDEYLRLRENQAAMFTNTLTNTAQNALSAAEVFEDEITRDMTSHLRLVGQMDSAGMLTTGKLGQLLQDSRFDEIQLYDSRGILARRTASDPVQKDIISPNVVTAFAERGDESMTYVLPDTARFIGSRLAVIVPRSNGGAIAGIVDPAQIQSFRSQFGFGHFLQRLQKEGEVEYIALMNRETIIAGDFEGYDLSSFADDPFLDEAVGQDAVTTRVIHYNDRPIFESVAPFYYDEIPIGVIRLGFSMSEFEQFSQRVRVRMLVLGGVIIVLGLVFLNFVMAYRHRKLLRRDLGYLQEYTNSILENLGSSIITVSSSGTIEVVNKQALRLMNMEYDQLFNKHISVLPEQFQNVINQCFNQEKDTTKTHREWYSAGGQEKWIAVKASRLCSAEEPDTCILLIDDVTEQARLDEQTRRNEKLTAMRKLASSVAHEIRNPLNSIMLIMELLNKKYKPADKNDKYDNYVETVISEIMRISNIVEEFLQYARPPKLKMSAVSFPEFFSEIETFFRARVNEAGIELGLSIEEHPDYTGDREKLKQVFVNLIENAVDATDSEGKVTITGRCVNGIYEISVADTGKGISKRDITHVFDLYYTTKKKGSGIGLSVVDQIVTSHQGTVTVESTEGKGAIFVVRLPLGRINSV